MEQNLNSIRTGNSDFLISFFYSLVSFTGKVDSERLEQGLNDGTLLSHLQKTKEEISLKLEDRLSRKLEGKNCSIKCSITFSQGSIEWSGIVELTSHAWAIMEILATVGGVAGFVQLVSNSVSSLVFPWFDNNRSKSHEPNISTKVVVVSHTHSSAKYPRVKSKVKYMQIKFLELSAFLASIGMLSLGISALYWVFIIHA